MTNYFGDFAMTYGTLYLNAFINGNVQFFKINNCITTNWYH